MLNSLWCLYVQVTASGLGLVVWKGFCVLYVNAEFLQKLCWQGLWSLNRYRGWKSDTRGWGQEWQKPVWSVPKKVNEEPKYKTERDEIDDEEKVTKKSKKHLPGVNRCKGNSKEKQWLVYYEQIGSNGSSKGFMVNIQTPVFGCGSDCFLVLFIWHKSSSL